MTTHTTKNGTEYPSNLKGGVSIMIRFELRSVQPIVQVQISNCSKNTSAIKETMMNNMDDFC